VIAGFAGSGKSTLVQFIIQELHIPESKIAYVAYTGKAALVLKSKGCPGATTAHKLLYHTTELPDGTFVHVPKEKPDKAKLKSLAFLLASVFLWFMGYNAVSSSFSVFAERVWNIKGGNFTIPLLVAQVSAIAMYLPVGLLASKIGRKKTILFGIIMMFTAFLAAFLIGSNVFNFIKVDLSGSVFSHPIFYLMSFFFALCGAGWATINVNSYPMVVEMNKNADIGKYTGYYYTASMAAQIVTPLLSGFIMDKLGTMKVLFPYAAIFVCVAFATMLFVKHGDSKPVAKKGLEALDADMD
jgi:MFS family permease